MLPQQLNEGFGTLALFRSKLLWAGVVADLVVCAKAAAAGRPVPAAGMSGSH